MLQPIENAPAGVVAFRAVGKITAEDYETTLTPAVAAAEAHGKLRLVYELGPEFDGYSAGAALADFRLGTSNLTNWERCAVVTDHEVIADVIRAFAILMPGEIRIFRVDQEAEALDWAAGTD